jgi:hypothetical protein
VELTVEQIVVAVLTIATVLTGLAVTEPARGTWHPAASERVTTRWLTGRRRTSGR